MRTAIDSGETATEELHRWWQAMARGQVVACVRGHVRPQSVAKWPQTACQKGRLDDIALDEILAAVERESVQPFLGSPWNEPARQQRFAELQGCLSQRRSG